MDTFKLACDTNHARRCVPQASQMLVLLKFAERFK